MNQNAILIFARDLQLERSHGEEPFASLPWDALDLLASAILTDLLENALRVTKADVLLFRNPERRVDEALLRFHSEVGFRDSHAPVFGTMVQVAVQEAFDEGYQRVIAVLDNQPTYTARMFQRLFSQLGYEHECLVVGPTVEGRCYLVGMKSDYHDLFDSQEFDPIARPYELLKRACALPCELFLGHERYLLETGYNLEKLKLELGIPGVRDTGYPYLTSEVFRQFEKKYRMKYSLR
jgi:hypothetical protein